MAADRGYKRAMPEALEVPTIVASTRKWFRLALLVAVVGGLMAWPQPVTASPCKPHGAVCRTNASCCGKSCEKAGEAKFGICCSAGQDNCGACGIACTGGTQCVSGECECPAGEGLCGSTCTSLQSDPNNCGQCGNSCAGECDNGQCTFVTDGATSSGSFPGLNDSQACINSLVAESSSGKAASYGCDQTGTCTRSIASTGCIAGGGTSAGTFPGLNNSQACINNLIAECCTGQATSGSCGCDQAGTCTGSIVCKGCIAGGETSAGTFPGLNNSQACINNLIAECCTGQAASGSCGCDQAGTCTGSIVCVPEPASGGLGAAALCAVATAARLRRRASPSRRGSCDG